VQSTSLESTTTTLYINGSQAKLIGPYSGTSANPYAASGTFTSTGQFAQAPTFKWVRSWSVGGSASYREVTGTATWVNGTETTPGYWSIPEFDDLVTGGATSSPTPATSATPIPSPGPSVIGSPTPIPSGASTPAPNVSVSNGGAKSDVVVDNPNDFYEPVRRAVADSGQGFNTDGPARDGISDVDTSNRGHLDDVGGEVQNSVDYSNDIADAASVHVGQLYSNVQTLPNGSGLGSVSSIDLGAGAMGSQYAAASHIALTGSVGAAVSLVRTILLWALTIAFLFMTIRAFTWQH
jgi:hypothetical protein